mgnify:CR=1 FL=1
MANGMDRFLDFVMQNKIQQQKDDADRQTNVLDSLLKMELQQVYHDKEFLKQQGVDLPGTDISGNLNEIIALTGNADISTQLQLMLNESKAVGSTLDTAIAEYNLGRKTAEKAQTRGGSYTAGETGRDAWLFSDDEYQSIIDKDSEYSDSLSKFELTGQEGSEHYNVSDAFKSGFDEGSYNLQEALAVMAQDQGIQETQLKLSQMQLASAEQSNNKVMNSVGSSIIANMTKFDVPALLYAGALTSDNEEVRNGFVDLLGDWNDMEDWIPNIKTELITAMQIYAGGGGKIDSHAGFVRMTGKVYESMLRNEELENALVVDGKATDPKHAESLLSNSKSDLYNEEYTINLARIRESASIGLVPDSIDTMQKAYITMQQLNQIEDGHIKVQQQNAQELAGITGFSYDEVSKSLELIDPASVETRLQKYDEINSSYDNIFGAGDDADMYTPEPFEIQSELFDVSAVPAGEKVSELRISKARVRDLKFGQDYLKTGKTKYNKYLEVDKTTINSQGRETTERVKDYENASYYGLNQELSSLGFRQYIERMIDNNPDIDRSRLGELNRQTYIPTPEEMTDFQSHVQKTINSKMNPNAPAEFGDAPLSNLAQATPGVGLFWAATGGVRAQGDTGVLANRNEVRDMIKTFEEYKKRWNQLRAANGLQRIALSNLYE